MIFALSNYCLTLEYVGYQRVCYSIDADAHGYSNEERVQSTKYKKATDFNDNIMGQNDFCISTCSKSTNSQKLRMSKHRL